MPPVPALKEVRVGERRRGHPLNDLVVRKGGLLS